MPYSIDSKAQPDNDYKRWSPTNDRRHFSHRICLRTRRMRCLLSPVCFLCKKINKNKMSNLFFSYKLNVVVTVKNAYTRIWRIAPYFPKISYISSEVILYGRFLTYSTRFTSGGNRIWNLCVRTMSDMICGINGWSEELTLFLFCIAKAIFCGFACCIY